MIVQENGLRIFNEPIMKYKYEVTLSFAGEDRKYVEEVAECLKAKGIEIFYDKFEDVELWGKDQYEYFDKIYRNESIFCIMFLSKDYAKKAWTNHERKSAQARSLEQSDEYILPVKLDDTEIPGIRPTVHYLDGRILRPAKICTAIIQKLGKEKDHDNIHKNIPEISIPIIKRTITDLEKKQFIKTSFAEILNYFEKGLSGLEKDNSHIETDLEKITTTKFVATLYVEGTLKAQCKIWIDSSTYGSSYSISYVEGTRGIDFNNDNTLNDSARVEDDGIEMFFDILAMSFFSFFEGTEKIDLKHASANDVAKYYWGRFIMHLQI